MSAENEGEAYARSSDPDTSESAADSVAGHTAAALEARVLEVLGAASDGLTAEEAAALLNLERVTISPRFAPLKRKGLVHDSGKVRYGTSNRPAIVWRLGPGSGAPKATKGRRAKEASPWNLSDEVPPPTNHPVLVWLPYSPRSQHVNSYFGGDYWGVTKVTLVMKTYWRELPPNPTEY